MYTETEFSLFRFDASAAPLPSGTRCISITIPDDDHYAGLLANLYAAMTQSENWEGDEADIADIVALTDAAYEATDWEGCIVDTVRINEFVNLFHINSYQHVGNAPTLIITASQIFGHYAFQSSPSDTDIAYTDKFWLRSGVNYAVVAYCVKGATIGKLKMALKLVSDDSVLATTTVDLYAAATTFNFVVQFSYTPGDDIECYISAEPDGKNASSTGYAIPITCFMVRS